VKNNILSDKKIKETKTERIMFRLSKSGLKALQSICDKKGINLSKLMMEAVKDCYIKNKHLL
jgi:predicted DNA binding CopG/RHH family protein